MLSNRTSLGRIVAALLAAGALAGILTIPVFAAPKVTPGSVAPSALVGQPSTNDSNPVGYYLWRDDSGYHLRTHGPGAEHRFVARLRTTGTFKDVDRSMLEKDDRFKLAQDGHLLVLRFHTFDGWDGVNFHIDGGENLKLNLKLDGQEISTDNIFVGPRGTHPPTNPFKIEV